MIDTDKFEKLEKEELENAAGGCGDSPDQSDHDAVSTGTIYYSDTTTFDDCPVCGAKMTGGVHGAEVYECCSEYNFKLVMQGYGSSGSSWKVTR